MVASFVADLEAQRRSQPITVPIPPTNIDPPLDQAMRKAVMNPGIQDGLKPMLPSSEPLSCTRRSPQGELRTGSPSSGVDSVAIFEKKSEEICSINSMSHPYIKRTTVQPGELQHYTLALAKIYYQTRLNRIEFVDEADDQLVLPVDDRQEFEASVTVHLNRWVSSRGFSISYSRYGQGCFPTLRFRQFNVRSEESLIFEFCSSGNVDGVRSLLSRGEASPFDTDPEGWTPLHVSRLKLSECTLERLND